MAHPMDANLKKILDELPAKAPRSRLEPFREFIQELRSRGRTYRDIAQILGEKCALQVTGSGVHDFVRGHSRAEVRRGDSSPTNATQFLVKTVGEGPSSSEEVQRKIAALKARNTGAEPSRRGFKYDPDEPLRLKSPQRH